MKKYPTNSVEQTEIILNEMGFSTFYLLDGNIIDCFEGIYRAVGINMLKEIDSIQNVTYLFTNQVIVELLNRPQSLDISIAKNNIINVEGGHSEDKENRFLIEEDGEIRVALGTKVSPEDWAQVLLCQNHPKLKLVSNDHGLIKNSLRAIGEPRTKTIVSLVQELITLSSNSKNLQLVLEYLNKPGVSHLKIKKGTPIQWVKPPKE